MVRRVVVKMSGRVFAKDSVGEMAKCAKVLVEMDNIQPVVVAGGGSIARHYIDMARSFGADEATLDQIGIEVSRLNARLFLSALGEMAHPEVPTTLQEIREAVDGGLAVAAGGLYPGQSTNGTAALIAEKIGADFFLNATDVDGVFDSDPRDNADAKLIDHISVADLRAMLAAGETVAGGYDLMDLVALKVIERSAIPTRIIRATPANIRDSLGGGSIGTKLVHR